MTNYYRIIGIIGMPVRLSVHFLLVIKTDRIDLQHVLFVITIVYQIKV